MMFFSSIVSDTFVIFSIKIFAIGTYNMLYLALCGNLPLHQKYLYCLIK